MFSVLFASPPLGKTARLILLAAGMLPVSIYYGHAQRAVAPLDSLLLRTVVIQATRTGLNSPVPHTNLTAANIARTYHAQDVPFLLSGVPSLVETSDGGTGTGYTGMRIRGSDPTRINVTLNGVPLNDAESQAVFWVNLPDLASSAAEIQVQRGVGSSTNGAGAFGATVNLDLSRIAPEPTAVLTNTLGSFNTRRHAIQLGSGLLHNRLAFTGRLSRVQSDGYIDRATADLKGAHLSGAYVDDRQSLMLHLLTGQEVTYQAWNGVPAQYVDDQVLRRFNTAGTQKTGEPYRDEVDNYRQTHYLAHYKRQLGGGFDLQINGHYTRGQGFFELYRAAQGFAAFNMPTPRDTGIKTTDLVVRRWLDNHFYGSTFALRRAFAGRLAPSFLLGGALSRYEGGHYGEVIWAEHATVANDFRYYDNDARKTDGNIFFKNDLTWRNGLQTFSDLQIRRVGYRFQGFDRAFNQIDTAQQSEVLVFFNPKIGFMQHIRGNWQLYGFAGIANREPNRDDFVQSTPASRPRPERLYNLEAGLKKNTVRWQAGANLFYMYYRNQLIVDGRINDVGAAIRTNVPRSYRAGIEIEAAAQPWRRLRVQGSAAWSQNRALVFTEYRDNWDTGEQTIHEHRHADLAFSPNFIGRLEATGHLWQQRGAKLDLTWSGKYVGRQFLDNTANPNAQLAAFFFSDMRLNATLPLPRGGFCDFTISVLNLFNERFASNGWTYRYTSVGYDARPDNPYTRLEGGAVYNQTGFFPQALRHWMATMTLRF